MFEESASLTNWFKHQDGFALTAKDQARSDRRASKARVNEIAENGERAARHPPIQSRVIQHPRPNPPSFAKLFRFLGLHGPLESPRPHSIA